MKIKVALAGATGWVGSSLVKAIGESPDIDLVSAIAPEYAHQNLGKVLNMPNLDILISKQTDEALIIPADVFVDFTKPAVVKNNVLTAINHGLHVVIGTSGLTNEDFKEINTCALQKNVGVIAAGNFSLTAALLKHFATIAARFIPSYEIIDYASANKPDAPSGTARELAESLSALVKPNIEIAPEDTIGNKEARGASIQDIQVHSVRLPSYSVSTEIIFGMPDERLIMRHEAGSSPIPYIAGVLLAIRKVDKRVGLIRGLDQILEFS